MSRRMRLDNERYDLHIKVLKLRQFMYKPKFHKLDLQMQMLINSQLEHMEDYHECLVARYELMYPDNP